MEGQTNMTASDPFEDELIKSLESAEKSVDAEKAKQALRGKESAEKTEASRVVAMRIVENIINKRLATVQKGLAGGSIGVVQDSPGFPAWNLVTRYDLRSKHGLDRIDVDIRWNDRGIGLFFPQIWTLPPES
jgi:hypothetical protein